MHASLISWTSVVSFAPRNVCKELFGVVCLKSFKLEANVMPTRQCVRLLKIRVLFSLKRGHMPFLLCYNSAVGMLA